MMQIYTLLTQRCNLKCEMCIRGNAVQKDMDFNILFSEQIMEQYRGHEIILTGGEPTLYPKFLQIVEKMSTIAARIVVTTNGTIEYYIEDLKNIPSLFVQVSIDGSKEVHDSIRGEGSFNKAMNTVLQLDQAGVPYSVASVVSKNNIKNISELVAALKELKNLRYWKISYEMPFGNAGFNDIITAEEWNDFVDRMIKIVPFRLKVKKLFPLDMYERKYNPDMFEKIKSRCYNCGSGTRKVYVYPDFNVYPCTCLTDFCLGNLRCETLQEILENESIKQFSEYEVLADVPCSDCKFNVFCRGGCIGMSYHSFGLLGKGDIRCPTLREHYEKKDILF